MLRILQDSLYFLSVSKHSDYTAITANIKHLQQKIIDVIFQFRHAENCTHAASRYMLAFMKFLENLLSQGVAWSMIRSRQLLCRRCEFRLRMIQWKQVLNTENTPVPLWNHGWQTWGLNLFPTVSMLGIHPMVPTCICMCKVHCYVLVDKWNIRPIEWNMCDWPLLLPNNLLSDL